MTNEQQTDRTSQSDIDPTPLEVTDIQLSEDGELVVKGRWHIGGHYGSKAANATVDLSETSISELIEDG